MELKLVEQLLEKYFQGETTIAEEKQLKAYFLPTMWHRIW